MSDVALPLVEHLQALAATIKRSCIALLAGTCAAWFLREPATEFLQAPLLANIKPDQARIVVQQVTDVLTIHLKMAGYVGFLLTMPYLFFEAWRFIMPGLYQHERRFLSSVFIAGALFFCGGAAFAYVFALPNAFRFLVGYSTDSGLNIDMFLSLPDYIKFVVTIMIAFGVLFEIPLLMVLSCWSGLASPDWFARKRGEALIILAILSAVFTPPDPLSMAFMLAPLALLYEAAIWVSRGLVKAGLQRRAAASGGGDASL